MLYIELRPFNDNDINLFKKWLKKPHIAKWYKEKDEWLYEINHRDNEFSFVKHFIVMVNKRDIGFCQYYDYRLGKETWHKDLDIDDTYSIDYLIGEEDYLGKHIATKIINALEDNMTKNNNVKKIIVKPDKDNLVSRKTLLSTGYNYDVLRDLFFKNF